MKEQLMNNETTEAAMLSPQDILPQAPVQEQPEGVVPVPARKRGRPAKNAIPAPVAAPKVPVRRGRPPKSQTSEPVTSPVSPAEAVTMLAADTKELQKKAEKQTKKAEKQAKKAEKDAALEAVKEARKAEKLAEKAAKKAKKAVKDAKKNVGKKSGK